MSAPKYIKCPCRHCGGAIEFPAHGIGLAVSCPHCNQKTTLFAPPQAEVAETPDEQTESETSSAAPDAPVAAPAADLAGSASGQLQNRGQVDSSESLEARSARSPGTRAIWGILLCLGVAGVGAAVYFRLHPHPKTAAPASSQDHPARAADAATLAGSNAATVVVTPPPALPAKSIEDLKVGPVRLEKAKGSSLVYAVGTLRNESSHQRFGVKLELELTGPDGRKVGLAKDYRSVLEPRQEWNFRALVLDPKAVAAKVATIREDE